MKTLQEVLVELTSIQQALATAQSDLQAIIAAEVTEEGNEVKPEVITIPIGVPVELQAR